MSKVKILFILGVWVASLPYLGFPYLLKNALFVVTGVGIMIFSYTLIETKKKHEKEEKIFDNFSENHFQE